MRTQYGDPIDRRLIAQLEQNARISASELARRIGLARSTVNERIARLERDGVILGYSAIVTVPRDNQVRAVLFLRISQRHAQSVIAALQSFPELRSCHSAGGQHQLICNAEVPSLDDLDALMEEIGRLPHVEQVDSSVLLATKFDRETCRASAPSAHNVTALHRCDR